MAHALDVLPLGLGLTGGLLRVAILSLLSPFFSFELVEGAASGNRVEPPPYGSVDLVRGLHQGDEAILGDFFGGACVSEDAQTGIEDHA